MRNDVEVDIVWHRPFAVRIVDIDSVDMHRDGLETAVVWLYLAVKQALHPMKKLAWA